jgi:hypothetical protein
MSEHEFTSLDQFRGIASRSAAEREAIERACYIKDVASFPSNPH